MCITPWRIWKTISNSGHDERGKYSGGEAGDQGGEWARIPWYSRPWTVVFRHPDPSVRGLIAQLAGEAADNNRIGYDQAERWTFWTRLKQYGFFPADIRILCEADCSAGVAAIVKAAGYILGIPSLQNVSSEMYTGSQQKELTAAGFAELRDKKLLTSADYLLAGDILLSEGHHTAINLDYGAKTVAKVTTEAHIKATGAFFKEAQAGRYRYGDSHAIPPCADHVTACDRGSIARPLWDLGLHDQPAGGVTTFMMEGWLTKHGWKKITDQNSLRRGDIVLMKEKGTTAVTIHWHTFLLTDFKSVNNVSKYDFGDSWRWGAGVSQPFTGVPLNEWSNKEFYCAFRLGGGGMTIAPTTLKKNTRSNAAYLATEILKARGYMGVKDKNGLLKDLELNHAWSKGDMAAMARYKWERIINGTNLCSSPYGAGEVGEADWRDLLGAYPLELKTLPDQERSGLSVLLCQEILRAREVKGKDGKPIELTRKWNANVEHAVKTYQKVRKLPQTGKVTPEVWRDMLGDM